VASEYKAGLDRESSCFKAADKVSFVSSLGQKPARRPEPARSSPRGVEIKDRCPGKGTIPLIRVSKTSLGGHGESEEVVLWMTAELAGLSMSRIWMDAAQQFSDSC